MEFSDAREAVAAEIERLLVEVDQASWELAEEDLDENEKENLRKGMADDARLAEALRLVLEHTQ